jgi:glycosyltransferase involved in cell wall biosynthesis
MRAAPARAPLHVLITVNASWNVWNFRRPVLSALLDQGYRVTVLAPEDRFRSEIEKFGCRFVPLEMDQKGLNPVRDLALLSRFKSIFARERPDVVLSYTIKNNIYGALAARSLGIVFIPNITGLGTAFLSGGLLQSVAELLYRTAFAALPVVFFQNEDDQELFLRRGLVKPGQARLLPGSGIDLDHFGHSTYPAPDTPTTFLLIARLLRDKGILEYVEAARMVKARSPEIRFQLLGAADAQNRSAFSLAQATSWQQSHGVEYLGTASDVRQHIGEAHCVVLPSYREGAPRTLMEAAAMGRPLIATDVPGCRSLVDSGRTGLLCTPRDARSLANTCLGFMALPHDARIAMGEAGRLKMEREYDQIHVANAYRRAIADLTSATVPERQEYAFA